MCLNHVVRACRLSKYQSQKKKQSLREERSSSGAQHSNLLFKYQVGTSTPVSEQEPRHMGAPQYRLNCKRQTFRLRRLHLLGPDACIFWARTPASTLHKSAQQGAPDAYIFLCKSTIQNMRAPRGYACPSLHASKRCVCHSSCACPRHTRVIPSCVHAKMHVPLPVRASKTCPRRSSLRAPKDDRV